MTNWNELFWDMPWWIHRLVSALTGRVQVRKTDVSLEHVLGFEWISRDEYRRRFESSEG